MKKQPEVSKYDLVYRHPALLEYVPSAKTPHLKELESRGLLDALTVEQCVEVVKLSQHAYRQGQMSMGAERLDSDAVWLDGVGGLEMQADGTWKLAISDHGLDPSLAAAALGHKGGSATTRAKRRASRANGKLGGRPRKNKK